MTQPNRTPAGGRIDRDHPLKFYFDGRRYAGYRGDTLASALIANDVHFVARSFKYHRPRGVLSAGIEEPNALVQVAAPGEGEPNVAATRLEIYEGLRADSQNRWPTLGIDVGVLADWLSGLMPPGFYYKTFMWPASMWRHYERAIRTMGGLGRAPQRWSSQRYDHMHAHCDVLVVGGGPAGLAAALAAGRSGARVMLADDESEAGGQLLSERFEIDGRPALAWVSAALDELDAMPEVRMLPRTAVTGHYGHNFLVGCQRFAPDFGAESRRGPHERLWKIRARCVVLATGATERPIVFPDNDRPGIMLASAVRAYLNRYGVRAGSRVVLVTTNDDAYRSVLDLSGAGVAIEAVVDMRDQPTGFLVQQARARGIEVLAGHAVVGTRGRRRVQSVLARPAQGGAARELECDVLAVSGGWIPRAGLFSQAGGRLEYDAVLGAFVPGEAAQGIFCAGSARGASTLRDSLAQGAEAGACAAAACGFDTRPASAIPNTAEPEEGPSDWRSAYRGSRERRKQFVDYQCDVTLDDIRIAAREGYEEIEHLKRYTTAGMGRDQGKTGNLNALAALAEERSVPIAQVGTTTFRPPTQPLGFGVIAGAATGELFDPVRKTPLHAWHERRGALFEDVGRWKRARYYPEGGEGLREAVIRECGAVRRGVALFDASTLGKIDIQGRDAGVFIDRIYCNDFRSLAPGRCRYGMMLRDDGTVLDDGVSARLAEHHYLMMTTTGGAARVLDWLEQWLQTQWPQLEVYCTCVSEHYVQLALSGPHSTAVLQPLTDVALETMAPMAVRAGQVAGIPARVFRISFAGILGYEVAVPAGRGYELWTTLMGAGERYGIVPYGTEAMRVLRAEKGHVIIGQDTDGSVTPIDLGLDRLVAKDKGFIGKPSLLRAELVRPDRKQLVGVLTEAPDIVLPEGAQLVAEPPTGGKSPVTALGHVTSSYYSPTCRRSIALALVAAGIARLGESVYALSGDEQVRAMLTAPRFINDVGEPLHG